MRGYLNPYKLLLVAVPLFSVLAMTACTNPHTPAGSEGYVFENPRLFGKGVIRALSRALETLEYRHGGIG